MMYKHTKLCPACRNNSSKLIKHQIKEFPPTERIICQDCHDTIEWYYRELDDIKAKELD